ncbi:DUF6514 family protein [Acetanaerobacterium elongatum]|uniref:Uncharacterized protein n=1 Tax=Acetanaerobacterium elongatum TaxID=258515 RepID=A0A1H0FF84_9FIRM|nr:DUF6514 family protein [Acetanaerobacterium elongatum]SDN93343.1 hypothetical protein SAMN05192585_1406 [Acetanaerobacterium elongatum]
MQGVVFLDKLENQLTEDMKITYNVVESEVNPAIIELGGAPIVTYGVSVTKIADSGEESTTILDISTDRTVVESLVSALRRGRVTPITVADVVEDYMALLF